MSGAGMTTSGTAAAASREPKLQRKIAGIEGGCPFEPSSIAARRDDLHRRELTEAVKEPDQDDDGDRDSGDWTQKSIRLGDRIG